MRFSCFGGEDIELTTIGADRASTVERFPVEPLEHVQQPMIQVRGVVWTLRLPDVRSGSVFGARRGVDTMRNALPLCLCCLSIIAVLLCLLSDLSVSLFILLCFFHPSVSSPAVCRAAGTPRPQAMTDELLGRGDEARVTRRSI